MRNTAVYEEVLAGLRAVLASAESRKSADWFKVSLANRLIWRLPGVWRGRWFHLFVKSEMGGEAERDNFLTNLRGSIAALTVYIEKNSPQRKSGASLESETPPIDVEYTETARPGKRLKIVE